jgi:hypothetical protein
MSKYRVVKNMYGFHVQIKTKRTEGCLWWKKVIREWVLVNRQGEAPYSTRNSGRPSDLIKAPFRTEKKARKFIKKVIKAKNDIDIVI